MGRSQDIWHTVYGQFQKLRPQTHLVSSLAVEHRKPQLCRDPGVTGLRWLLQMDHSPEMPPFLWAICHTMKVIKGK